MGNIKSLSDSELLNQTQLLAAEERKLTIEILHHLPEIDRRKLYTRFKCGSLFEYCEKVLKYSGGSASRRVNATRLLKNHPETEEKLTSGALTLTHLSQIAPFEKSNDLSTEQTASLLRSVEGKSSRECQTTLANLSPQTPKPDQAKPIGNSLTEIRFTASTELMEKIKRVKGLLGHQLKDFSYAALLDQLSDIAIKKYDPRERPVRPTPKTKPPKERAPKVSTPPVVTAKQEHAPTANSSTTPAPASHDTGQPNVNKNLLPPKKSASQNTRYLSAALKRAVWERDHGKCTRCSSIQSLHCDHVVPFALGGPTRLDNLRLLCHACNAAAAIEVFGVNYIEHAGRNFRK